MTPQPRARRWLAAALDLVVTLGLAGGPAYAAWLQGWRGGSLGDVGWIVLGLLGAMVALGWRLIVRLAARPAHRAAAPVVADQPRRWKEPAGDGEHRRRVEPHPARLLTTSEHVAAG